MRILNLLLLCFCCGFTTVSENDFFEKIIGNTHRRHDCYLSVFMYRGTDTLYYVVENHFLYSYMSSSGKEALTFNDYKADMLNVLSEKQAIPANFPFAILEEKWHFMQVRANDTVRSAAAKGQDYFISQFFDNGILKDGIAKDEKTAIISQLFNWHIASQTDDETGYLIIPGRLKGKQ